MATIIIDQSQVSELLPMDECIGVMEGTLAALARGDALMPLRQVLYLPSKDILATMPAYLGDTRSAGVKVITVFPNNRDTEYDAHQGVVLLFDTQHGCLEAIMDATAITGIRTAAVSAVATKHLAREDAGDLAILGSGAQAHAHLEAMRLVRSIRRVRVWSPHAERARAFAGHESAAYGIEVEAVATAQQAVEGADVICTVTSAREPVLRGDWVAPGAHINAVGACTPSSRELDTAAVAKSRLFVDRRESALNEAGDILIPKQEGALDDGHVLGEIGEVVLGQVGGRTSPKDVTLFKSLGLAVEDIASAQHIVREARERGIGLSVELGGRRH